MTRWTQRVLTQCRAENSLNDTPAHPPTTDPPGRRTAVFHPTVRTSPTRNGTALPNAGTMTSEKLATRASLAHVMPSINAPCCRPNKTTSGRKYCVGLPTFAGTRKTHRRGRLQAASRMANFVHFRRTENARTVERGRGKGTSRRSSTSVKRTQKRDVKSPFRVNKGFSSLSCRFHKNKSKRKLWI